ncbi:hypothetical protein BN946_scf184751.g8 [Trametes cinnabarina]|uniref:Uncharacterized protein n=1 Tax=Pycnoporus cinnabarinus TaxID=5643 RepID=A0A060SQA3_PYCCI|nr:hypothetical protein BN946_scf184751.g8 [Trametes cinnabarina]
MQFKPSALLAAVVGTILASSTLVAGSLVINTPAHARQCIPTLITWEGDPGLFFLLTIIIPQLVLKDGEPIQEYGGLPADQYNITWPTNVRAGTTVTLSLNNEAGEFAYTSPFTIKRGPDNCNPI